MNPEAPNPKPLHAQINTSELPKPLKPYIPWPQTPEFKTISSCIVSSTGCLEASGAAGGSHLHADAPKFCRSWPGSVLGSSEPPIEDITGTILVIAIRIIAVAIVFTVTGMIMMNT